MTKHVLDCAFRYRSRIKSFVQPTKTSEMLLIRIEHANYCAMEMCWLIPGVMDMDYGRRMDGWTDERMNE